MTPSSAALAVALYAGLNGLILLWLTVHVGQTRRRLGISLGDGGDPRMLRAMRGQANFVELVPLILLQLAVMALMDAPAFAIHALGLLLTVARLLHGWHFTRDEAPGWLRAAGAGLTILTLLVASLGLAAHALYRMV